MTEKQLQTAADNRRKLASLEFCRSYLHLSGMITDSESDKIFKRIRKFQDSQHIEITPAQLYSVMLDYDDNAKDNERQH